MQQVCDHKMYSNKVIRCLQRQQSGNEELKVGRCKTFLRLFFPDFTRHTLTGVVWEQNPSCFQLAVHLPSSFTPHFLSLVGTESNIGNFLGAQFPAFVFWEGGRGVELRQKNSLRKGEN